MKSEDRRARHSLKLIEHAIQSRHIVQHRPPNGHSDFRSVRVCHSLRSCTAADAERAHLCFEIRSPSCTISHLIVTALVDLSRMNLSRCVVLVDVCCVCVCATKILWTPKEIIACSPS